MLTFKASTRQMGPPDRLVTRPDGSPVADWLLRRGRPAQPVRAEWRPAHISMTGVNRNPLPGPPWKRTTPGTPDRVLRLTFAPDATLAAWEVTTR